MFLRIATAPSGAAAIGGAAIPLAPGRVGATLEEDVVLDPPQRRAAYFGHDTSARVVLWALVRASAQQHLPLDCMAGQPMRAEANNNSDGGGIKGSAATLSWQFREGVLLVYEGVLKHLVEGRLAGVVVSGGVGEPSWPTTSRGGNGGGGEGCTGEWPAELLHAAPPLGELLVFLLRQVEDVLYGAEMMRSRATSCPIQQQPSEGALELWRAGSQLLPTIGRAMLWWNPRAIRR